jgi:hypothetical protein
MLNHSLSVFSNRHNLFLHSALVLSRKTPNSVRGINVSQTAKQYYLVETFVKGGSGLFT